MEYEVIKPPSTAPQNDESFLGKGLRNITRLGSRAVETAAGLPGDITNAVLGLAKSGIEKLSGVEQAHPGTGPFFTSGDIRQGIESTVGKSLPEGYLKPKGSIESGLDTLVSDIASLTFGGVPAKTAAKTAAIGNAAGWLAKSISSEDTGEAVKLGTMILYPFKGDLKNYINKLYSSAESSLPPGAIVSSEHLTPSIDRALKIGESGIGKAIAEKKDLFEIAEALQKKIAGNRIPVSELWEAKKDINSLLLDSRIDKKLAHNLRNLNTGIRESLNQYGKSNPSFRSYLKDADELFSNFHTAGHIREFMEKHIPPKTSNLTATLVGTAKKGVIRESLRKTIGSVASLEEAITSIAKSPAARKYYTQAIRAAAKKNGPLVAKSIANLDRELKNLPSSGEYEVVTPPS